MKRYRDMTYHGGDSSKEARATVEKQTRFRLVREAANGNEAVYEPYTVDKKRGEASWVACFAMEVADDLCTITDSNMSFQIHKDKLVQCAHAAADAKYLVIFKLGEPNPSDDSADNCLLDLLAGAGTHKHSAASLRRKLAKNTQVRKKCGDQDM